FVVGRELELIAEGSTAGGDVIAGGYVDLVKNVVVEVVLVRSDAGFLKRIDAERSHQRLDAVYRPHKGINISGIGRGIKRDQRRIHVTGSQRRARNQGHQR